MGLFRDLFGSREPPPTTRDLEALARPFVVPAVHLTKREAPSRSHLGGVPALSSELSRPEHEGKPLGFLARVSLHELQETMPIAWLPSSGDLLFFYDLEKQPWGFDPADRGSWAVIHAPDPPASSSEAGPAGAGEIAHAFLGFRRIDSYPRWADQEEALELTDAEIEGLDGLAEREFDGLPCHQIAGCASPVQNDTMELECQLASHGIYCGDSGYLDHPRTEELAKTAGDWKLLLQLDSDDDLGIMWGDGGMLYFWVREQEARAGDFSNVWLILQCF